jgi:hypothetical protein
MENPQTTKRPCEPRSAAHHRVEITDDGITFLWPDLGSGDCHQTGGMLVCTPDGSATFSCTTWTTFSHFGDIWHTTIKVQDAAGNTLFDTQTADSPRMTATDPITTYNWNFTYPFDKSLSARINGGTATQYYAC